MSLREDTKRRVRYRRQLTSMQAETIAQWAGMLERLTAREVVCEGCWTRKEARVDENGMIREGEIPGWQLDEWDGWVCPACLGLDPGAMYDDDEDAAGMPTLPPGATMQ